MRSIIVESVTQNVSSVAFETGGTGYLCNRTALGISHGPELIIFSAFQKKKKRKLQRVIKS